jgi:hypothetical protein
MTPIAGSGEKKAESASGSSFGSSAVSDLSRPVAFRLRLTAGLALSWRRFYKYKYNTKLRVRTGKEEKNIDRYKRA